MQLIATSDFRNPSPDTIEVEGAQHPAHIHKGARFSIGSELPLDKMTLPDRKLIAQLNAAGRVVDASNKAAAEAIDKEVAAEKKRLAALEPSKPAGK